MLLGNVLLLGDVLLLGALPAAQREEQVRLPDRCLADEEGERGNPRRKEHLNLWQIGCDVADRMAT